mgnify:CR=1 FL=1
MELLTVLVAAYNEAEALPVLHPRIAAVLDALARDGVDGRVLYVDDGSRDGTWAVLQRIAQVGQQEPRIGGVRVRVQHAEPPFEHCCRTAEAGLRQVRRGDPRVPRPTGIQALGPRPVGQILE